MSSASDIAALRDRIRRLERPMRHGVLPFGVDAIDRALPGRGLALGAVHEIFGQGEDGEDGAAAAGFAAGILARLGSDGAFFGTRPGFCRAASQDKRASRRTHNADSALISLGGGPVLWSLKRPDLYGPGLLSCGFDPARLVIVRAPRDDDVLRAVEEGLRCPDLAAVVGEVGRLPMAAGRRLQLAAERSGVTALLLRRWRNAREAAAERTRPSAAATRWRVTALPSADPLFLREGKPWVGRPRWRVELLRCRGGEPAAWDVEIADATGSLSLSAGLADRPAAPHRRLVASFSGLRLEQLPGRLAG